MSVMPGIGRVFFTALVGVLIVAAPHRAAADCTNPDRSSGTIIYNEEQNVPQVCAGDNWVALGTLNPAAGGGSCSNPDRTEGAIVYNVDHDVLQYCDGTNWIAIAAVPGGGGGGSGGTGGSSSEKIVFVTADDWPGLIGSGGTSGADTECQTAATNAGLSGTYKAWIGGVFGDDPNNNFLQATVPYRLVDGTTVADDWTDLTDGTLDNGIDLDENGASVLAAPVWTQVNSSGGRTGTGCPFGSSTPWNWVGTGKSGGRGLSGATDSTWTSNSTQTCEKLAHLYCFEQ